MHRIFNRGFLFCVVVAIAVLAGALGVSGRAGASAGMPYGGRGAISAGPDVAVPPLPANTHYSSISDLYSSAKAGEVESAIVDTRSDIVYYSKVNKGKYAAFFVDGSGGALTSYLLANGVRVRVGNAVWGSSDATPFLLVVGILSVVALLAIFVARRYRSVGGPQESSSRSGGKSLVGKPAGLTEAVIPTTKFDDVAGADEAVADLREFVEFLTDPGRFEKVGAKIPKGALLCGPPGTGKTLLARAVAGEAGVPFFACAGSDFNEMYVGVGSSRVRELFEKARSKRRAIIFIDEIDAIAKKRSDSGNGADSEKDSTLMALLNEMDGFRTSGVIVLAATNRPDVLDPAIKRSGRLDRRVEVPNPDRRGREHILAIHSKEKPLAEDVDFEHIARRTSGMSGADLAQVVNDACIEAARAGRDDVNAACFDAAVSTVAMGRARHSAVVTEKDRLVTAWHEAGHTVCAYVQDAADRPVSVSIIPRGPAGGVTWMSEGDELFMQRSKASARLVTALGGRAAEELLLGDDYTQGAYGDLQTATQLATAMAAQYGMTDLGLMVRDPQALGQAATEGITATVEKLLVEALDEARRVLAAHSPFVEALVAALLDEDTLSAAQIDALYESVDNPVDSAPKALLASLNAPKKKDAVGEAEVEATAAEETVAVGRRSGVREKVAAFAARRLAGKDSAQPAL